MPLRRRCCRINCQSINLTLVTFALCCAPCQFHLALSVSTWHLPGRKCRYLPSEQTSAKETARGTLLLLGFEAEHLPPSNILTCKTDSKSISKDISDDNETCQAVCASGNSCCQRTTSNKNILRTTYLLITNPIKATFLQRIEDDVWCTIL